MTSKQRKHRRLADARLHGTTPSRLQLERAVAKRVAATLVVDRNAVLDWANGVMLESTAAGTQQYYDKIGISISKFSPFTPVFKYFNIRTHMTEIRPLYWRCDYPPRRRHRTR